MVPVVSTKVRSRSQSGVPAGTWYACSSASVQPGSDGQRVLSATCASGLAGPWHGSSRQALSPATDHADTIRMGPDGGHMRTWWGAFRRWPVWAQVLVWVAAWPVPLTLLAIARPERRRAWGAAAVVGSLVWAALVFSNSGEPRADADGAAATTTTSEAPPSTIDEQIATTTTEPQGLGPIPDIDLVAGSTSPALTGGLSALGSSVFDAEELLGRVDIAAENESADYERDLFDEGADDDGDGCRTRAEVLIAESITRAQVDPSGCRVLAGDWRSIYDGYTTDDPAELEVDHLVALKEAWVSGAWAWSPARRHAFANDLGYPGTLVAVTAAMNTIKSDRDPSSWQPPNRSAWCLYAADWLTVKARWSLTMDAAEATALRNMLAGCGVAPTTTTTTTAPPSPPPTTVAPAPVAPPTTASRGGCDPSYPTVCIPPAPPDLDCGDIPYRRFTVLAPDPHGFDGNDNDGLGCESG